MYTITDARGSHLDLFRKMPQRIVSLVPSLTELLHDLGLESEVVGITKFCVHPQPWFKTKTRIGGTKNINLQKVIALNPDLILANKEENIKDQIEALAEHFPVWVTDVTNLREALQMIETVGTLTGKKEKAIHLKSSIEVSFSQLQLKQQSHKTRACYLIWNEPYMTVGGDTFINAMLEIAGFENCFVNTQRYPVITIEAVAASNCQVLLLSTEPYPFSQRHIQEIQPQLPNTKIVLADGEMFSWYGSRLLHAAAYFQTLWAELQTA